MIVTLPLLSIIQNSFIKNNTSMVFLYELLDPRTMETRYIGKTINIKKRYNNHISDYHLKAKTKKNSWIKSLKAKNLRPIMRIIAITTEEFINQAEIYKISERKKMNDSLLNMTLGGDGQSNMTEEVKQKIKNSLKGLIRPPCSEQTKLKISNAQKGVPRKPWTLERYKVHTKSIIRICPKTGEQVIFSSLKEAAISSNLKCVSGISKVARNFSKYITAGGYLWKFKEAVNGN